MGPQAVYSSLAMISDPHVQSALRLLADSVSVMSSQIEALSKRPVPEPPNINNIKLALQAGGSTPLVLTGLPGAAVQTLVGTHATRLVTTASAYALGTGFVESDRNYLYVVETVSGVNTWVLVAGVYVAALASRPSDLGVNDHGAMFFSTDGFTQYTWDSNASLWKTTGGALEQPEADSTTAYRVRNAAATNAYLTVDTTNGRVGIGTNNTPATVLDVLGTVKLKAASNATTTDQVQDSAGNVIVDVDTTNRRVGINIAAPTKDLDVVGDLKVKSSSNSTSAAQVIASGGAVVMGVDTTNARVGVNNATPAVDLDVTGVAAASTGYRQNGTEATATAFLGSNGTNFVGRVIATGDLPASGVAAGTYVTGLKLTGGGVNGQLTVDAAGRITAITAAT